MRKRIEKEQVREKIERELDFDQVMQKSRNYIADEKGHSTHKIAEGKSKEQKDEVNEDQHLFDLSFLKSDAGFFSDNEDKRNVSQTMILSDRQSLKDKAEGSEDIDAESVILSDSSLASAMGRFKKPVSKSRKRKQMLSE